MLIWLDLWLLQSQAPCSSEEVMRSIKGRGLHPMTQVYVIPVTNIIFVIIDKVA